MTMLENSVRSLATALASLEAKLEAGLTESDDGGKNKAQIAESLKLQVQETRKIARDASKELSDIIEHAESLLENRKT